MKALRIIVLLGASMFCSCSKGCNELDSDPKFIKSDYDIDIPHYVQGYWDYESLDYTVREKEVYANRYAVRIILPPDCKLYGYLSEGEDLERYEELCAANNDMEYVHKFEPSAEGVFRIFSAPNVVSIDVVSDADLDANHPAGTSLNDVFYYNSRSAKPYIDSNYTLYDAYYNGVSYYSISTVDELTGKTLRYIATAFCSTEGSGYLDEFNPEHFLVGGIQRVTNKYGDAKSEYFVLCELSLKEYIFVNPHPISLKHNFTATFTFDDGRQMSVTFPMDWTE